MGRHEYCSVLYKIQCDVPIRKGGRRTSLTTIYPMVLWMNFFLMCGFAYIIFCAVTVRNLGKLFLPIFLLSTFAPLVFYLGKDRKARQKLHEEMGDYVHIERTKEGEVYRAHVDLVARSAPWRRYSGVNVGF